MSAETTAYWTKLLVLVVMTTFACFSAYVVMFVLGSLVSKATEPLVAVIESSDTKNTLTYSTDNPSTSPHTQANPSASSNEQEASQ